jgi:hypothetical protein
MKDTIVFDIDGVLADCSHRVHFLDRHLLPEEESDRLIEATKIDPGIHLKLKDFFTKPDWDAFYDACDKDKPIEDNMTFLGILKSIEVASIIKKVFMTGRPEKIREKTRYWLGLNAGLWPDEHSLIMRADGDHREDYIVKKEMAEKYGLDRILCVFEDRKQVVDMWRSLGITCYQTCEGSY